MQNKTTNFHLKLQALPIKSVSNFLALLLGSTLSCMKFIGILQRDGMIAGLIICWVRAEAQQLFRGKGSTKVPVIIIAINSALHEADPV